MEGLPEEAASPPTAASTSLSITSAGPSDGSIRVHVVGEIDMATAPRLRVELLAAVAAAAAHSEVRVDLAHVTFIDAVGVGVLVRTHAAASRSGVSFAVEHPTGVVLRVLTVLDLVDTLVSPLPKPTSPPD